MIEKQEAIAIFENAIIENAIVDEGVDPFALVVVNSLPTAEKVRGQEQRSRRECAGVRPNRVEPRASSRLSA